MATKHVIVVPYDERWARDFAHIRDEVSAALGELSLAIEHVGSTSVPGLSAKPIIDIDVVISDRSRLPDVVSALNGIGYIHQGDLGIPGREAFKYVGPDTQRERHLYVCAEDSAELKRHIAFRDWLRAHPDDVREYSRIKAEGAALYPYDIDKYIAHKSPFIERVYRQAGITKPGRIIFLNGVTSSGKTSIVEALQARRDVFFYVVANDLFQEMIGEDYLRENYWRYLGEAIMMMYHTAKLFSDMGKNVLIDGILVEREGVSPHYERLRAILRDNPLDIVEVFCPLDICRQRNVARGDRYESQSDEQAALMARDIQYSMRVDTSALSPAECADAILRQLFK